MSARSAVLTMRTDTFPIKLGSYDSSNIWYTAPLTGGPSFAQLVAQLVDSPKVFMNSSFKLAAIVRSTSFTCVCVNVRILITICGSTNVIGFLFRMEQLIKEDLRKTKYRWWNKVQRDIDCNGGYKHGTSWGTKWSCMVSVVLSTFKPTSFLSISFRHLVIWHAMTMWWLMLAPTDVWRVFSLVVVVVVCKLTHYEAGQSYLLYCGYFTLY